MDCCAAWIIDGGTWIVPYFVRPCVYPLRSANIQWDIRNADRVSILVQIKCFITHLFWQFGSDASVSKRRPVRRTLDGGSWWKSCVKDMIQVRHLLWLGSRVRWRGVCECSSIGLVWRLWLLRSWLGWSWSWTRCKQARSQHFCTNSAVGSNEDLVVCAEGSFLGSLDYCW